MKMILILVSYYLYIANVKREAFMRLISSKSNGQNNPHWSLDNFLLHILNHVFSLRMFDLIVSPFNAVLGFVGGHILTVAELFL